MSKEIDIRLLFGVAILISAALSFTLVTILPRKDGRRRYTTFAKWMGLILACMHFAAYVAMSSRMGFFFFFLAIDLPISLIIVFIPPEVVINGTETGGDSIILTLLSIPNVILGLFGTIWWYFLPRLFMPRKLGGLWGKKELVDRTQS